MSRVTCQISVSLDGYAAGPDQSLEDPLGRGGMGLHEWFMGAEQHPVDAEIGARMLENDGAYVMGRNMFGPGRGPHDEAWRGWWGEEPPYHAPVYVLTHHPREPLEMEGGTRFHFVTGGIEAAVALARQAAGDKDVAIAGGASTVDQALRAGLLDELYLHLAPITLGAGERLFADVGELSLKPVEVVASPAATHVRYAVGR
jgi:dihydrofolate reductase